MVLQELDLFCVLLQVPVPLLLYLCLIVLVVGLVVRLMVEEHRQEEVAVGVEGHVVMVRYVELQCLFGQTVWSALWTTTAAECDDYGC